jgi:hypothetical protein
MAPKAKRKSISAAPKAVVDNTAENPTELAGYDPKARKMKIQSAVRHISTRANNPFISLRVRQLGWKFMDMTITMPRISTVFQLQHEIVKYLHTGSVNPSEVMVFFPKKPETGELFLNTDTKDQKANRQDSFALYGEECVDSTIPLSKFLGSQDPAIELDSATSRRASTVSLESTEESPAVVEALIPPNIWKRKKPIPNTHISMSYSHEPEARASSQTEMIRPEVHQQMMLSVSGAGKRNTVKGGLGASLPLGSLFNPNMSTSFNTQASSVRPSITKSVKGEAKGAVIDLWYDIRPYLARRPASSPVIKAKLERVIPEKVVVKRGIDIGCHLLMLESKSLQQETRDDYLTKILSLKLAEDEAGRLSSFRPPDEESSLIKSSRRQKKEVEEEVEGEAFAAGILSRAVSGFNLS